MVDRSISVADAIGTKADPVGVGVEALRERRLAAKGADVGQRGVVRW